MKTGMPAPENGQYKYGREDGKRRPRKTVLEEAAFYDIIRRKNGRLPAGAAACGSAGTEAAGWMMRKGFSDVSDRF